MFGRGIGGRGTDALHCCNDPVSPSSAPVALNRAGSRLGRPVVPEFLDFVFDKGTRHAPLKRKGKLSFTRRPIGSETGTARSSGGGQWSAPCPDSALDPFGQL